MDSIYLEILNAESNPDDTEISKIGLEFLLLLKLILIIFACRTFRQNVG